MLALGAALLARGETASAQPRTYPQLRCGIPPADYQFRTRSDTLVQLSSPAIPLELVTVNQSTGVTTVTRDIKVFQLPITNVPAIPINDRKISRVAFIVHRDGTWSLSLRADFHDPADAINGPFVDAEQRRSQFRVKVNCFTQGAADSIVDSRIAPGMPVVMETPPIEFWVQSGEPYDLWRVGRCQNWEPETYERVFELLERAEVEFSYYEPVGYSKVRRNAATATVAP
jgi:hypothetical protein